jgi:short-chain fatty acids transporter
MTDFQAQPRFVRARASPPSAGPRISAQLAKLGIPLQQHAELIPALSTTASASAPACEKIAAEGKSAALETMALAITAWSERWFPDTFVFATLALALACAGAMLIGATPQAVAVAFGDGFWNLMPFTMQMVIVVVTGHVVARALPTARLIERLARLPRTGRGAVAYVAIVSMATSLLNWAVSLIFAGL